MRSISSRVSGVIATVLVYMAVIAKSLFDISVSSLGEFKIENGSVDEFVNSPHDGAAPIIYQKLVIQLKADTQSVARVSRSSFSSH
ncbi:hypothetical protein CWC03_11290 [Pseudoalteromonas sp. S2755]|nr:hypothetical protein CWC03_11290 [Pseudoalteromonas sp. S2755]